MPIEVTVLELLQILQINGAVLNTYAVLSMTLAFKNDSPFPVRGLYTFSLPQDAEIAGMKIVHDGHVLCSRAVPIREAESKEEDGREILLKQTGENTYTLLTQGFAPAREYTIVLDFFCPLCIRQTHSRLTLPIGGCKQNEQYDQADLLYADIHLDILGGTCRQIYSPSHPEQEFLSEDEIQLHLPADRDVVLDFTQNSQKNIAYAGGNLLGKTGLFFLNMPSFGTPKKLPPTLFLMDLTACSSVQCAQAKNIVYLASRTLGEGADFAVMATGEETLFRSFETVTDSSSQSLAIAEFLKKLQGGHGDLEELLCRFDAYQKNHDVQGIFVTSKDLSATAEERLLQLLEKTDLHFLTFGDKSDFPRLDEIAKTCGACITHVYPHENMMASVRQFIQDMKERKLHHLHIKPIDTPCALLPEYLSITTAGENLCFSAVFGDTVPQAFSLSCDEGDTILHLDAVEEYDSFRFADIFYARQAAKQAETLMETASPASWQKLKQKLEQIGVRYNCLNTETVLRLEDPDGISHALSVSSAIYGRSPFTKTGMGIFGEKRFGTKSEERQLLHTGLRYLRNHLHSDGSISSCGETDYNRRAEETLFAAVVFGILLAGEEQLLPVFTAASNFLQRAVFQQPSFQRAKTALENKEYKLALNLLQTGLRDLQTLQKEAAENPSVLTVSSLLLRILNPGGTYEGIL